MKTQVNIVLVDGRIHQVTSENPDDVTVVVIQLVGEHTFINGRKVEQADPSDFRLDDLRLIRREHQRMAEEK